MSDDTRLIGLTLKGQTKAFEQLVVKYQERLFNTMFHVIGHAEDARDIVQEALVQAFLKLESFRQKSQFYTWLYRIAFNLAMSHRRRQRAEVSLDTGRQNGTIDPESRQTGPMEQVEATERCRLVREAIGQLDDEYRNTLVLREIDGYPYEVIAEILDIPVGTVRSRLHRARLQLKDLLQRKALGSDQTEMKSAGADR